MERRLLKCHDGKLRGDGFSDVSVWIGQKVKSIVSWTERGRESENGKKLDCPAFGLNGKLRKRSELCGANFYLRGCVMLAQMAGSSPPLIFFVSRGQLCR